MGSHVWPTITPPPYTCGMARSVIVGIECQIPLHCYLHICQGPYKTSVSKQGVKQAGGVFPNSSLPSMPQNHPSSPSSKTIAYEPAKKVKGQPDAALPPQNELLEGKGWIYLFFSLLYWNLPTVNSASQLITCKIISVTLAKVTNSEKTQPYQPPNKALFN